MKKFHRDNSEPRISDKLISATDLQKVLTDLKVRLHWRDFARDFALACTFS